MCAASSDSSKRPGAAIGRAFHHPPELLQLLKDTIPLLCASKKETLLFFLGAGVPEAWLADMKKQVETCRADITKCSIARDVLDRLNRANGSYLREFDELVLRVAGFDDFSICGPTVRVKAQELVAEVGRVSHCKPAVDTTCVGANV